MNWKLTLTKSVVAAGLAALIVWQADISEAAPGWAAIAIAAIEFARDYIKTKYGQFVPND